jgi:hypothetical protein
MTMAGKGWGELDVKGRAPYEKLATQDAERYETEMAEWTKNGYFTKADGTKSNKDVKKSKPSSPSKSKSKSPIIKKRSVKAQTKAKVAKILKDSPPNEKSSAGIVTPTEESAKEPELLSLDSRSESS